MTTKMSTAIKQWTTPLKGVSSLQQTEAPAQAPQKGEVLVDIQAVSLNYRDVEGIITLYPTQTSG